jgi:lysozyme family protein
MTYPQAFLDALKFTLLWEGGYVNNPNDPGGATMKGVTQATYDGYLKTQGLKSKPVKSITDDELHAIYYKNFWQKAGCDNFTPKVATAIFDFVVNSGFSSKTTFGGMQIIQRAFGLGDDGKVGQKTINGINGVDEQTALEKIQSARKANYERLGKSPKLSIFKAGWLNRLAQLNTELDINLA